MSSKCLRILVNSFLGQICRSAFCLIDTSLSLQVRDQLFEERRRSFRVSGGTACTLCHKKIGTSVFAAHPDNRLVHFSCYKEAGAANLAAA
jgi:hypothetical protein